MSIELVMPSNHLVLYPPLLHLPSIFPSISVFSNESALCIRWPKYWSFSSSISPSNEYSGLFPLGLTGLILQSKGFSRIFSNTTVLKHQFFSAQLSLWSNSLIAEPEACPTSDFQGLPWWMWDAVSPGAIKFCMWVHGGEVGTARWTGDSMMTGQHRKV